MKYHEIDIASNGEVHPGVTYDDDGVLRVTFHGEVPEVVEVCVVDAHGEPIYTRLDLWSLILDQQKQDVYRRANQLGIVAVPSEVWEKVTTRAANAAVV